ncbi:MAG: hypothetical protein QOF91_1548 [Alphaproteobacteria bacterium]|nr:hypothetical protein [Alphaproteobacteria bacterium]MEA3026263.1 hypothetical protein [Alphaproteobacteria bacterium]
MLAKQDFASRMAVLLLPGLLYATPVVSQSDRDSKDALDSSARPEVSTLPKAPVGHRQPTAADIPKDLPKDTTDEERAKRDRELDAKLRICRGC